MAKPNVRDTTIIGVMEEVTEGTFLAPAAATDYVQPEEDGFEMTPSRELLERNILNSSIGSATPKLGMKSVAAGLTVEMRASGVEGGDTDFGKLLKAAMGATRSISTTTTTKSSGNTATVLQIEDADISKFNVGDIVLMKQSGAYHVAAITAKSTGGGTASITVIPPHPSGDHTDSVVISKTTMFLTSSTGHPSLSLAYYWSNTWRQAAAGCRPKSMSIDNFTVGQLAKFVFALEGLSYSEADGAAPHTPTFDVGTPPVILSACLFKDGVDVPINTFGLQLENTLGFQTSTCSPNGKVGSRITERVITGTLNPYMDDASSPFFDLFDALTEFSIFIRAYIPSSVSGEVVLGSVVGIWLPKCIVTEYKKGDLEGLITDEVSFRAVRGASGDANEEMYIGFI